MPLDFRITVYAPNAPATPLVHGVNGGLCIINDASADAILVQYEDTPTGCGAGKLTLGMFREDVDTLGYYTEFNLFEISSGDMRLTYPCASGATVVFLDTTEPIDPAQGEDAQILYFYDGANLTMRVPVLSLGVDTAYGPYARIGTPDGVAGNPSVLPAYGAGAIVGRRRYVGRLALTSSVESRSPGVDITLVGLTVAWTQATGSVAVTAAANVDVATALYEVLLQFASTHWPFFNFVQANFPTTGFIYSDTLTQVSMDRFISDCLGAIPNADAWYLRVGHDRAPRLVHAFTASSNTYTYTRTLIQGVTNFEPQQIEIDENNIANTYNAVTVTGGNAVGTQTPVVAQVVDQLSIDEIGFQIDGPAASNSAINTTTAAANFGAGLLAQNSLATAANRFIIWTDDDAPTPLFPGGPLRGDVVRGLSAVYVQRFDKIGLVTNFVPDSVIEYGTVLNSSTGLYEVGPDTLWTVYGTPIPAVIPSAAPDGYNVWEFVAQSGPIVYSPPIAVNPGDVYTYAAYVNTSLVVGTLGGCGFGISASSALGSPDIVVTSVTGDVNQVVPGQTFTIPAGVYTIYFWFLWFPPSGTTGQVRFSNPNLVKGSEIKPYVVNSASPTLYGLTTSAVTTIDLKSLTSKQEVQFAAIIPDWAFYQQQRLNAAVTALLVNKQTPGSVDQYCVSSAARNFTTSGLTVTFPDFLALFAPQTPFVKSNAQTVALEPSQTNYVWLTRTGTTTSSFNVQQSPSTLAQSILIAYFTTSRTGVLGSFFCAPIGVFNLPNQGNVPMDPTIKANGPTISAASYGALNASGSGAVGVPITFTIGDWAAGSAPDWFAGLESYWRVSGTTAQHASGAIGYTEATVGVSAAVLVPSGSKIDIGLAYVGVQSDQSTVIFPAGLSGIATPFPVGAGVPPGASITLGTPTYTVSSSTSTTVALNVQVTYNLSTTDTSWVSAFFVYFGYYDPQVPGKSALLTQFPVLVPPQNGSLIFGTTLNANSSTAPIFRYYFYVTAVAGSNAIVSSSFIVYAP